MLLRVLWELVVSSRHGRVLILLSHTLITPDVSEASNLSNMAIKNSSILLERPTNTQTRVTEEATNKVKEITLNNTLTLKCKSIKTTIYYYLSNDN
jgi:hypothetical protein